MAQAEGWVLLSQRSASPEHREKAKQLAAAVLSEALKAPQPRADELAAAGMLCESAGDLALAESGYNRALALNGEHPIALNNLAMILANRGEVEAAEEFATRAANLKSHPNRSSFLDTLATVQAKMRKWKEASAAIAAALELAPGHLGYQIHQAVILTDAGDANAAGVRAAVLAIREDDPRLSETDRKRLRSLRPQAAAGS
jgi:Tfp pilus assembly protein PilF